MSYHHRQFAIRIIKAHGVNLHQEIRVPLLAGMTDPELFRYALMLPLPEPNDDEEVTLRPDAEGLGESMQYVYGNDSWGMGDAHSDSLQIEDKGFGSDLEDGSQDDSDPEPNSDDEPDDGISTISTSTSLFSIAPDSSSTIPAELLLDFQLFFRKAIISAQERIAEDIENEESRLYLLFETREHASREREPSNLRSVASVDDVDETPCVGEAENAGEAGWGDEKNAANQSEAYWAKISCGQEW